MIDYMGRMSIEDRIEILEKVIENTHMFGADEGTKQIVEWLKELKAYKEERVSCEYCKDRYRERYERPCSLCKRNFVDMFKREVNADDK